MKIDINRLLTDIIALEERIREIKGSLRQTWTEPMDDVQAEAHELAAEVTTLYTLRAWARGRLHRTQPPASLRDACVAMGTPLRWDAEEHNRTVAEGICGQYVLNERERRPAHVPASPPTSIAS